MDTVYAPRDTPLVREARSRGAMVVDGEAMFLRQAELQSALFLARW
jgi:shikimate 5-dehydrogenase